MQNTKRDNDNERQPPYTLTSLILMGAIAVGVIILGSALAGTGAKSALVGIGCIFASVGTVLMSVTVTMLMLKKYMI